jgi:hypothetical protein
MCSAYALLCERIRSVYYKQKYGVVNQKRPVQVIQKNAQSIRYYEPMLDNRVEQISKT